MKKKIIIGMIVISAFLIFSIVIIQNYKLQKEKYEITMTMQNENVNIKGVETLNEGENKKLSDVEGYVLSGNEKALNEAKAILVNESNSFLKDDLIKKLKQNGFSEEEIIYAMDNCKLYWNEKALNIAIKSVESNTPHSYKQIIDILEALGFTNDEATYGADNCGANWNEQADRAAKDLTACKTRDTLIEILKSSGFTEEQAEYAADVNGY